MPNSKSWEACNLPPGEEEDSSSLDQEDDDSEEDMLSSDEAKNVDDQKPHEEGKEIQVLPTIREEDSKDSLMGAMK